MTLDTRAYIHGEIGALDVFNFIVHQLLEFDRDDDTNAPRPFDRVVTRAEADTDFRTKQPAGTWTMETRCGQGLPAWLMVHYRPGGKYRTAEDAAQHDASICNLPESEYFDDETPVCDGTGHRPACHVEISMDTSYGWRGPNGMRASVLHGVVLARLTEWLSEQGVAWSWMNEYTGEIHPGGEGLEGLLGSGEQADAWFDQVAFPAIRAEIERRTAAP